VLRLKLYPNPFNNKIDIGFQITDNSRVKLEIYDATGRLVKQYNHLVNQPFNQVSWDGRDNSGYRLPNGVYFVQLETKNYKQVEKIILVE